MRSTPINHHFTTATGRRVEAPTLAFECVLIPRYAPPLLTNVPRPQNCVRHLRTCIGACTRTCRNAHPCAHAHVTSLFSTFPYLNTFPALPYNLSVTHHCKGGGLARRRSWKFGVLVPTVVGAPQSLIGPLVAALTSAWLARSASRGGFLTDVHRSCRITRFSPPVLFYARV
jgi:hypothetical protein